MKVNATMRTAVIRSLMVTCLLGSLCVFALFGYARFSNRSTEDDVSSSSYQHVPPPASLSAIPGDNIAPTIHTVVPHDEAIITNVASIGRGSSAIWTKRIGVTVVGVLALTVGSVYYIQHVASMGNDGDLSPPHTDDVEEAEAEQDGIDNGENQDPHTDTTLGSDGDGADDENNSSNDQGSDSGPQQLSFSDGENDVETSYCSDLEDAEEEDLATAVSFASLWASVISDDLEDFRGQLSRLDGSSKDCVNARPTNENGDISYDPLLLAIIHQMTVRGDHGGGARMATFALVLLQARDAATGEPLVDIAKSSDAVLARGYPNRNPLRRLCQATTDDEAGYSNEAELLLPYLIDQDTLSFPGSLRVAIQSVNFNVFMYLLRESESLNAHGDDVMSAYLHHPWIMWIVQVHCTTARDDHGRPDIAGMMRFAHAFLNSIDNQLVVLSVRVRDEDIFDLSNNLPSPFWIAVAFDDEDLFKDILAIAISSRDDLGLYEPGPDGLSLFQFLQRPDREHYSRPFYDLLISPNVQELFPAPAAVNVPTTEPPPMIDDAATPQWESMAFASNDGAKLFVQHLREISSSDARKELINRVNENGFTILHHIVTVMFSSVDIYEVARSLLTEFREDIDMNSQVMQPSVASSVVPAQFVGLTAWQIAVVLFISKDTLRWQFLDMQDDVFTIMQMLLSDLTSESLSIRVPSSNPLYSGMTVLHLAASLAGGSDYYESCKAFLGPRDPALLASVEGLFDDFGKSVLHYKIEKGTADEDRRRQWRWTEYDQQLMWTVEDLQDFDQISSPEAVSTMLAVIDRHIEFHSLDRALRLPVQFEHRTAADVGGLTYDVLGAVAKRIFEHNEGSELNDVFQLSAKGEMLFTPSMMSLSLRERRLSEADIKAVRRKMQHIGVIIGMMLNVLRRWDIVAYSLDTPHVSLGVPLDEVVFQRLLEPGSPISREAALKTSICHSAINDGTYYNMGHSPQEWHENIDPGDPEYSYWWPRIGSEFEQRIEGLSNRGNWANYCVDLVDALLDENKSDSFKWMLEGLRLTIPEGRTSHPFTPSFAFKTLVGRADFSTETLMRDHITVTCDGAVRVSEDEVRKALEELSPEQRAAFVKEVTNLSRLSVPPNATPVELIFDTLNNQPTTYQYEVSTCGAKVRLRLRPYCDATARHQDLVQLLTNVAAVGRSGSSYNGV